MLNAGSWSNTGHLLEDLEVLTRYVCSIFNLSDTEGRTNILVHRADMPVAVREICGRWNAEQARRARMTATETIRRRALAKLTNEERRALGLKEGVREC